MHEWVAVILAAGQGTRMKSKLPKVLHPLLGEPMIRYVVNLCRRLPVMRTVVVVGYQADRVKGILAGHPVEFALQEEQLGTAHALLQTEGVLKGFDGGLLVLSGDVPLVREETLRMLLEEHVKGEAAATLLSTDLPDPKGYGRIVRGRKGEFLRIVEEAEASTQELKIREVNIGIYAFTARRLFPVLKEVRPSAVKKEYYLPGALDLLRRQGHAIHIVKVEDPEEGIGINSRVELARAQRVLQRRILFRWMEEGVTILDPEATLIGPAVEIGRDAVIYPHVFLEGRTTIGEEVVIYPGCRIRDSRIGNGAVILDGSIIVDSEVGEACQVGPYAHLRPGATLKKKAKAGNFVEIKQSVIGEGSKVPHLTYVGDSIVGDRVNIGAGTITCNYDGFAKHQTVIEDEVFVGSNSSLVAPVTIGRGSIIAAGSVITQDVPPETLAIARAPQVNKEGRAGETRRKRKALAEQVKAKKSQQEG